MIMSCVVCCSAVFREEGGYWVNTKAVWADFFKALKNSNWDEAIKQIDLLIDDEPRNFNHYLKRGDICQKQGDKNAAIKTYLKAANILTTDGFQKKAAAVYKMVLRLDPQNQDALNGTELIKTGAASGQRKPFLPPMAEKPAVEDAPTPPPAPEPVPEEPPQAPEVAPAAQDQGIVIEQTAYSSKAEASVSEMDQMIQSTSLTEPPPERDAEKTDAEDFLGPFNVDEIEEILKRSEVREYGSGEPVVSEGDAGDSIYIIKEGDANVIAHILGKEIHLASLTKGDMFGEVAYITGKPRTADVISTGSLEVYEINRVLLEEITKRRPEIMAEIKEIYMARVQDTIRKVKE